MKKIISIIVLCLIICSPVYASIYGYRLGGMGTNTLSGVKCISASTTGSNNYMTLETPVGTDYQVTAGYTFYITKIIFVSSAAATVLIGYGDTGVGDGADAPTNFVQLTYGLGPGTGATTTPLEWDVIIPIPAGKYPCIRQSNDAATLYTVLFGVEIAN